jgi:hypothetical protein
VEADQAAGTEINQNRKGFNIIQNKIIMRFTKNFLITAFLAFSISCSMSADNNPTNAISQKSSESATAINSSNNKTSDSTSSLNNTAKNSKKTSEESNKKLDESETVKPPFVGMRSFVIDAGVSGSGTPQYYLKINENNDMFCGFTQTNQADGTETKEEIPLGKFKKIFDCNFKNDLGVSRRLKVEGNYIYEVDKNDQVAESDKCCKNGDDSEKCECKSELYK